MDTITGIAPPDARTAADRLETIARLLGDVSLPARRLGALGEDYAAAWLQARGHRLLARNWRTRYGELDIVARDPQDVIAFVEVKTRRTRRFGLPQEAVTEDKRRALRRAGAQWLLDEGRGVPRSGIRFDVIALSVGHGRPMLHLIREAF